jgi:phage terminase large subunit-like protein
MHEANLAQELRKLDETVIYRWEHEKYRYFVPTGKGEEYINNIASNKYIVSLISAANGIGKSLLGVNFIANLIWPCGNPFFQQDLILNWPYPKTIRIISDPAVIADNIIPKMKEYFPRGRFDTHKKYQTTKGGKQYESKWTTDTGWEISVMTYEQDPTQFEGATLGLIWFDEPPPYMIYKASIARLRAGGTSFITATPLTGSAWMYDEIITNPNNEAGFRSFVEADVESACEEHGVRGFLKHDNIMRMIAQYDPEDMQARVFGKFQHLIGLIFKNYTKKVHELTPFPIKKKDWVVVEAFDYHPRTKDAISFVAIDRSGRKIIVDEIWGNYEEDELVELIKSKEANYRIIRRILDQSAFIENQHDQAHVNSFAKRLANAGLLYHPGSKRRTDAIKLTRNELNYQEKDGYLVVPPRLFVFETCQRHIFEFTHWQWDDWRGKQSQQKNPKEVAMDKDDHFMENIGRVLLENPQFEEMPVIKSVVHSPLSMGQVSTPGGITNLDPYK